MSRIKHGFLLGISMGILFLGVGCGMKEKESINEQNVFWAESTTGCLDENGYFFLNNDGILHYFDIASGKTVPVCDKVECKHQKLDFLTPDEEKCSAQLDCMQNGIAVYHNNIYYYKTGDDINRLELHSRNLDGTNDKKIAVLPVTIPECEGLFYHDKLLATGMYFSSETFDAETKTSEESCLKLFLIDLGNGDVKELGRTIIINDKLAYGIQKAENGKFYYYCLEDDLFYMVDAETGEQEIQKTKCDSIAFDGKDFDTNTGMGWRYTLFRGDYCYGHYTTNEGISYFRINVLTGERKNYLVTELGNYQEFVGDANQSAEIYDWQRNREKQEFNRFFICSTSTQEKKELTGDFVNDFNYSVPLCWTDTGAIFMYWVDIDNSEDFEYRYMSRKDLLDGNSKYQIVYYQKQGDK